MWLQLEFHIAYTCMFQAQSSQPAVQQPKLGAKEMADLEKELELDLENLDVNTDVSIFEIE
ncbi:hypothetical protein DPMN_190702 [Dreissena polymorpha]|uniref:Uncharacterized protein n=1 Tax=Dreissena polymorpha TaxID=45954 RepID=A0A9D3Y221_DREPO|nr:hypothetical protein DPMN_190702 [Dreissena polymorpha]